jgi:N utilization substance protein B
MNRRLARETVFKLLFEHTFHEGRDAQELYATALTEQEWEDDTYVKEIFFGAVAEIPALDEMIEKHSRGWKKSRISPVSLSILRLACYEMSHREDIPYQVSINEALELVKRFDDAGARAFVNGILHAVATDLGQAKA